MAFPPEEIKYQLAHIHDDRSQGFITSVAIVTALATVAVTLRLLARRWTKVGWAADDYTIMIAVIMAWGMFVGNYYEAHFGQGKHFLASTIPDIVEYGKLLLFEDLAYASTTFVVQISFLLFYKRVFTLQNPRFKYAVFGVAFVAFAVWIGIFFATVFNCHPVAYDWDRSIPNGSCGEPQKVFITGLALNLFTDICIVALPIPMIWKIQISLSEKIAVSGAFLLGGFVCVGNLIRLPYLINVNQFDLTWSLVGGSIWGTAEVCIGIISACLPCFRPFLRFVKQSIESITGASRSGRSTGRNTTNQRSSRTRGESIDMDHSLVGPRHRWDTLSRDGQTLGVESEVRSDGAQPKSSDVEKGIPSNGIDVKRDVYMTSTRP